MNSAYEEIAAAYEAQAAAGSRLAAAFQELAKTETASAEPPKKKATTKTKTAESLPSKEETPQPDSKPAVSLEDVRRVLAQKSVEGHTEEVRALIERYGAKKLSDLGSECYEPLLMEAEGIGNGK
ncbi:MAG: hypothetical protein E7199_00575 [Schwartzia succinivorans]|nr:hypothetical protein [Schwartzia succinivorans]